MNRWGQLALGLALAALFGWLTLRMVDGAALAQAARGVDLVALALAPGMLALGYACRVQRWRRMLRAQNPGLGFARAGVAFVGSIAVNNLAPFRLGDVLRCFGFSRWLGVAPGPVIASVLVERLLDMIALLLALALALWAFSLGGQALGLARGGALVLAGLGLLALALLLRPRLLAPLVAALIALAARLGAGPRAASLLTPLMETLTTLSGRREMPVLIGWTLPVWAFEGATYWAVARALPALPVPEAAWLAMPAGTLATLLPSTPGHVGTFDYFAQLATLAAGNPLAQATAFVLIVHAVLWLTTTLTGGICLMIWGLARR